MRPDHTELLDRATPDVVPSLDYDAIARRGRRRRGAHRVVGMTAAVALLAGTVAVGAQLRQPTSLEVTGSADTADTGTATGPDPWTDVGSLATVRQDLFAGTIDDGRVVVYGGTGGTDDLTPAGTSAAAGVLLDPTTGAATAIPAPPIADRSFPSTAVAANRLVVFGGNAGDADGAVYDAPSATWSRVPPVPSGGIVPVVRAWDGTTLIVGDTTRVTATGRGYDNLDLWQWQVGDTAWQRLPDSTLDAGVATIAYADGRLAAWTTPTAPARTVGGDVGEDVRGDVYSGLEVLPGATEGTTRLAIYDLAAGRWTLVDRGALPATDRAALAWAGGQLQVIPLPPLAPSGSEADDQGQTMQLPPPVRIDPSGRVNPLAAVPAELQTTRLSIGSGQSSAAFDAGAPIVATTGNRSAAWQTDGGWTAPVDATQIVAVNGTLVALDNPGQVDATLTVRVWRDGAWRAVGGEHRAAREFAATATTDDAVVLIGGSSMRSPQPGEPPDVRPTEAGDTRAPYVIDGHRDVIAFRPAG